MMLIFPLGFIGTKGLLLYCKDTFSLLVLIGERNCIAPKFTDSSIALGATGLVRG